MNDPGSAALQRALMLSREILEAAQCGDGETVEGIDGERLRLLKFARGSGMRFDHAERSMLDEIARLNAQSLESLQRHCRLAERRMDAAATGRRALRAYGCVRRLR